jgi:hypothetical protein
MALSVESIARKMLELRILPRFMMIVMTLVYIRVIEWGISVEQLSTQQSAMISVVSGSMTGSLAVWLNSEKQ